uniref:Uncharacterized protein n=1 Tax=Glossina brevipalpis TaxID=37001 RepID=A0A1A9WBL4_9MUSC
MKYYQQSGFPLIMSLVVFFVFPFILCCFAHYKKNACFMVQLYTYVHSFAITSIYANLYLCVIAKLYFAFRLLKEIHVDSKIAYKVAAMSDHLDFYKRNVIPQKLLHQKSVIDGYLELINHSPTSAPQKQILEKFITQP